MFSHQVLNPCYFVRFETNIFYQRDRFQPVFSNVFAMLYVNMCRFTPV